MMSPRKAMASGMTAMKKGGVAKKRGGGMMKKRGGGMAKKEVGLNGYIRNNNF